MLITKENLKFVRYGGLSPVHQHYNPKMPDFHSPPARKGFYAFVYPFIEDFLLSSEIFQPHRMEWIKDHNGNNWAWFDSWMIYSNYTNTSPTYNSILKKF